MVKIEIDLSLKKWISIMIFVFPTAWRCSEGPRLYNARQIDAGQGKVVAINSYGHVYFLIGSSWYRMSSIRFKHASIGPAGLWATGNSRDKVYKYIAGNFVASGGNYYYSLFFLLLL